jgi:hypothetical protein
MNKALAVALFAAAGVLVGCASGGSKEEREAHQEEQDAKKAARDAKKAGNPAPCPNVVVLSDAARAIEFDGDQTLDNVAYTAEILDVELACRYYGEKPIEASVKLDLAFGRGPKGADKSHSFTYFVAVTRTNMEVIEKAEYTVPVEFGDEERVRTSREKIGTIVIPRKDKDISGTNFEVVIGFSLTPQQAIFNRSGKSLKFPDLKK